MNTKNKDTNDYCPFNNKKIWKDQGNSNRFFYESHLFNSKGFSDKNYHNKPVENEKQIKIEDSNNNNTFRVFKRSNSTQDIKGLEFGLLTKESIDLETV